jgi:predicted nucleotidyltransferase
MINLRTKDQQQIELYFKQVLEGKASLWAFGSRVKNTNHDASDLDLVVVPYEHSSHDSDGIHAFQSLLQESDIPILVQVLNWQNIPPSFQKQILQEKEVMVA